MFDQDFVERVNGLAKPEIALVAFLSMHLLGPDETALPRDLVDRLIGGVRALAMQEAGEWHYADCPARIGGRCRCQSAPMFIMPTLYMPPLDRESAERDRSVMAAMDGLKETAISDAVIGQVAGGSRWCARGLFRGGKLAIEDDTPDGALRRMVALATPPGRCPYCGRVPAFGAGMKSTEAYRDLDACVWTRQPRTDLWQPGCGQQAKPALHVVGGSETARGTVSP